jgi:hypothetical protein
MKQFTAIIATGALVLLAAACSGRPSSANVSGPGSTARPANSSSAVAYSQCMRSHGVPSYPDPGSDGALPKTSAQSLGVSNSTYQTAENACHRVLPASGESLPQQARQCSLTGDCPPSLVQHMLAGGRIFARCMRSHAVPNWPDPSVDSQGRPFFNVSAAGLTHSETHSQQMTSKAEKCWRVPGSLSLPMG